MVRFIAYAALALILPVLAKIPSQPSSGYSQKAPSSSYDYEDSDETTTVKRSIPVGQSSANNFEGASEDDSSADMLHSIRRSPQSRRPVSSTPISHDEAFNTARNFPYSSSNSMGINTAGVGVGVSGYTAPGAAPTGGHPLMRKMSSMSLCVLFLFMAWRDVACYEMAALFESPLLRLLTTGGTVGLLLLNLVGFVLNLIQPFKYKAHLKIILASNTVREMIEIVYYLLMFLVSPGGSRASSSVSPAFEEVHEYSKDTYLGRIITTLYFLLLCISATRMRWVKDPVQPNTGAQHAGTSTAPLYRQSRTSRSYAEEDDEDRRLDTF